MKQTTKYVGLDVHQDTTVACVRDETNRILARQILSTQAAALIAFVRGMRGKIHVAFEEGTQAQWLHDLLEPVVESVLVCNRRGESSHGHKGDWRDAEALAELRWRGALRGVYHGGSQRAALKEFTRTYAQLVEDCTRVMQRLKALFRARAITTRGQGVYHPQRRAEWLAHLTNPAVRFRAQSLYDELDVLLTLRPRAKRAMLAEARRDPAWAILRSIPFLGEVRVAVLLAILQTPWRFRTKRQLWAYSGLAVVTRSSAEYTLARGRPVRRRRAPLTRGLNRNHNRDVKNVFKSAATAATARPGALQTFYQAMLQRGMQPDLARVTLTRKLAALTLHCWKRGERYDPTQLTVQAT
ncbi:MAG: IS110 family transposase [Gemmatimonadaceae bacterium]